ncbi:nitroreductase family protein [Pedobacter sp. SAFR-022]|uniref:nitroreductase family protein n=1 Tax=Pedobacter sp. SAFR-022 TaxID=3436861 RepID=UPI003F7F47DC
MEKELEVLQSIIKRRRSVFPVSFTQEEISVESIETILESANYAPTHKLTQPWRFSVFRKEGKTRLGEELARAYKEHTPAELFLQKKYDSFGLKFQQSSCVIVLKAQLHPALLPEWEEVAALACAVQNMALTAEAMNIGAYWSSPGPVANMPEFLELQDDEKVYGVFYMGYHNAPAAEAKRTPMAQKVKWIEA